MWIVLGVWCLSAGGCKKGTGTGVDDVDPEFVVNVYTEGDQMNPVVVAMPGGLFLVVWESGCLHDCQGQDGSELGVYARRFEPSGLPLGGEFRVNDQVDYNQADPAAVMLPDGRFAIVWATESELTTDYWDVRLKLYGSEGVELTGEIPVNTETVGTQWRPRVGLSSDGVALVIWEHEGGQGHGIMGRRFDSYGDPLGASSLVSGSDGGEEPDLASVPDGRAVVVWSGGGWGGSGILAQILAEGEPVGDTIGVNESIAAGYPMPSVAMGPGGEFVVAWSGADGNGEDEYDIKARAFSGDASPITDELAVNTDTSGLQMASVVTMSLSGDQFLVAWESKLDAGANNEVIAKTYLLDGTVQKEDFVVNSYQAEMQDAPSATPTYDGFLVAWQSSPETGTGYNVYVRLFPLWL
jgi:hypothetical protein